MLEYEVSIEDYLESLLYEFDDGVPYFRPFVQLKKRIKPILPKRNILKEYLRRVWFLEIIKG